MSLYYTAFLLFLSLALFSCQVESSGQETKETKEVIEGTVPVNRKVLWKFSPCGDIQVNDKKLKLGTTLKEWVAKLGPYDRFNRLMTDVYTWDKYGMMAATDWKKDTIIQMHIVFHYESDRDSNQYDPNEDMLHIEAIRAQIAARPTPVFDGGVLLDGVVLGRGMNIKEFNQLSRDNNRSFYFSKNIFPHRYSFFPDDCPTPTAYTIQLSADFKDVEQIFIDNSSNAVWEVEQELKQEKIDEEKQGRGGSPE